MVTNGHIWSPIFGGTGGSLSGGPRQRRICRNSLLEMRIRLLGFKWAGRSWIRHHALIAQHLPEFDSRKTYWTMVFYSCKFIEHLALPVFGGKIEQVVAKHGHPWNPIHHTHTHTHHKTSSRLLMSIGPTVLIWRFLNPLLMTGAAFPQSSHSIGFLTMKN